MSDAGVEATRRRRGLAGTAGLISASTMASRLLGLVREQLFAALLGASHASDAFQVAFRIPNLLRDLFAEGALSQAFVPTFKRELKQGGPEAAYALANRTAGTLLAVTGLLVLLGVVSAPGLVDLLAAPYRATPGKFELTVELTRLMMPFLSIVSLAAVAMGMLNAQDRYVGPALAPALFNVASIVVGVALWAFGVDGRTAVIGWSIGTLLGGLAQLGVQLPSLRGIGYRFRARADLLLRDPAVRQIALLMLPAAVGVAAVQINVAVNTFFASSEAQAVSWLNFAFRFLHLPIGVFAVAIATVSTTRYADAASDGDRAGMARQLENSLRLAGFLTVPATVGLVLLGEPIVALVYQHGHFDAIDTRATADALELYAVGLVAYAAVKVVAPAFYAVRRARVPMVASLIAVGGNVGLNIALYPFFGYRVLALNTAVAAILNFAVLYGMFTRRIATVDHAALLGHLARVLVAAGAMGAAVYGMHAGVVALVSGGSVVARALAALVPVVGGAVVYALACRALKIEEVNAYLRRLRRRR